MLELGPTPRFLITRLSAIGDCIHTTPLVAAIRQRYPRAFIAWATQPGPAKLLDGMDGLDALIRIDRNWLKRPSSIRRVRRDLRAFRIDVSIDPQSLTKSSLLGWLSGARRRIGFTRGQARELSPWLNNCLVEPTFLHVVDRYLELLRPLGIDSTHAEFCIPQPQESVTTIERFLTNSSLQRFVLLNPGAGWNSKIWPHERYARVARHLADMHRVSSVVLWAGEQEKRWATSIADQSPAVLAPDTSLPELAELCRRADLFVGSDTGPMHLAAAVGTRCVAMYGPTHPEVCGPYGSQHCALQVYFQQGTSQQRRGDDNSAMQAISIDMVTQACDTMLIRRAA